MDDPSPTTGSGAQSPHCSFCNKTQKRVSKLIAGPDGLFVCSECISLFCDILAEQDAKWRKRQIKRMLKRDQA